MEMEDKESTESGSLIGNSASESAPSGSGGDGFSGGVAGGDTVSVGGGGGGGVAPLVMNVMNLETSVAAINPPAVTVGGILGGGGGGSGELTMGKKKRGRPRKYDADGNLRVPFLGSPPGGVLPAAAPQPPPPSGFSLSPTPASNYSSGSKRGRGRIAGSGNWQILASLGELFTTTAGGDFTPHVITVYAGEDVAGKILTFARKGPRGICVLSANGSVSNVTIRQPGSSGGILTYEGRFEILTLTGSFTFSENGGIKSRTGGLSVSLAGPDGRVVGGGIAGILMAATPIQMVVGSFTPNGYKMPKRKHNLEQPRAAPPVQISPVTVTAATPISQTGPQPNISLQPNISPLPPSQLTNQGEADNNATNKEYLYPTVSPNWNGAEQISNPKPSPDINISVSIE